MKTPTSQNQKVRHLSQNRERLKKLTSRHPARKSRLHHIPANLTKEAQWEAGGEPPQVKTSRMFIGMLALHLVAVGGLVAFHYFGHDPAPKMLPSNGTPATASPRPAAASVPSIPPPAPSRATTATAGFAEHIVRIEETWETIAAARGLTVDDLRSANPGIDCNVGRRLLLPPTPQIISAAASTNHGPTTQKSPTVPSDKAPRIPPVHYAVNPDSLPPTSANLPTAAPAAPTTQIGGPVKASAVAPVSTSKVHIVSKGETVFSIAKKYHTTEKTLMRTNGLTDAGKLRPGQKLKMPNAH